MHSYSRPHSLGTILKVEPPPPLAGADFVWTSSAQYLHQIIAISFTLTCGAAVANRLIQLTLDDGADVLWRVYMNTAITANQAIFMTFCSGSVGLQSNAAIGFNASLPEPHQFTGVHNVRSIITGLQGADAITAIIVNERVWIP